MGTEVPALAEGDSSVYRLFLLKHLQTDLFYAPNTNFLKIETERGLIKDSFSLSTSEAFCSSKDN